MNSALNFALCITPILMALLPQTASSQVSFTGTYSQNFDSLSTGTNLASLTGWSHLGALGGDNATWMATIPSSGTTSAATPGTANNTLTVNSNAAAATARSNTVGYNFALSGSTSDRCIGTSPTTGAGNVFQLRLTNSTGSALTAIRIGYDIRRFIPASANNELPGYRLFYSTDNGTTWTSVSALDPVLSGGTVNVPNTAGVTNVPLTTVTLATSVANGSEIRFRWIDDNADQTAPDHIVGLDNVSIQLPVNNNLPTCSLTAPTTGATFDAPATINLTAAATDSDGTITRVEFFNGATKLGEDDASPYEFSWNPVYSGSYTLTARATDNLAGTTTSTAVNITVTNLDNVFPTVTLTAPTTGSTILTTSTTLTATAADTDGTIAKVEFFNGVTKLGEDTTSPFEFDWTGLVNGNYALTAVATDNDGSSTTSTVVNVTVATPITSTLIARRPAGQPGSVWKYLDNGTDQGTAWRETAFNDSTWASGAAPLGFSDAYNVTTLSFGPDAANKFITHYFRRTFEVTNPTAIQTLNFNILRDDGVVVYINGVEVLRQNMPEGPINYLTVAPVNVEGTAEGAYNFSSIISPPALIAGTNVIAVELHNRALNSSDAGFDLELISLSLPGASPTVALTAPTNGATFTTPATLNLTADAADTDGTVTKVEFFASATKIGEDTASPYEFLWTGMLSGPYTLTARATDNVGNMTPSAPVNIIITNPSNVPPTIALTSPSNGSTIVTTTVALAANAADSDGIITKVEFFNGATKLGEDLATPYTFNWTGLTTGVYTLTAVATDNDGATTTSSPVTLNVGVPVVSTAIARGATWKYLDNGSDQGTAWKESSFNDTAWASGAAPLGYGDTHIATTVASGPAGNRIITTYLRRTFNLTSAAAVQSMNLNILRDDGVVVYINGTEVARQNMPAGPINHLTNAASIVDAANETTYFPSVISPLPPLNNGTNVIAVEVHNRDGNSSDLGFDLDLTVQSLPGTPPTVALTAPAEGDTYTAPATVNLTADAADSDGAVTRVEFFAGAEKIGEITAAPFNFSWSVVPQGSYSLTARATDNFGLATTSAPVNISVGPPNTVFPTVAITSPAAGATFVAPATVQITAAAADTDGTISKVEFFNGATKLGEDDNEPYIFTWNGVAPGSYSLTARAIDNLTAATTSAPINITVTPNQAPTITLASPANSASLGSSGTVNLTATVADPEGAPLAVTFYGRPKVAPPGPDFTLVTIPDTQFYSQNSNNRIQFFNNQTNWIVASKNLLNTQFVAHMGDMTQEYNAIRQEFINADGAMDIIEDPVTTLLTHGIPWGGAPGNHDIGSGSNTSLWNEYFGIARFSGRPYFGGGYTNNTTDNNYMLFSASGLDFIVVNLMYNISTSGDNAVLNWADMLLKAHPNRHAIVTSHTLIRTSFPPTQALWNGQGQAVYDKLKVNPNLFLMLCGHIHGEGRRSDTFEGRTVNTVLQDYQSRANGGDSWLRYYIFSPANNTISARTYKTNTAPVGNPLGGTFETDADSQFTFSYDMSGGNSAWMALGTVNLPGGTSTASVTWNGLAVGVEYEWYAAVSDGVTTPVGSSIRGFTTNGNAAPSVTLTAPANGASFNLPATVPLAATATDIDGIIAKVEFFNGATEVGEDTEAPFTFDWAAPVGSHSLTARATDGQGATTDSAPIAITVINPTPTVTLTATDNSASEFGADQILVFTVTRSGPTTAPLSVNLTASGSATSADYSGFVSPLVIPIGASSADLALAVLPDALTEGPEILTLTLAPDAAYAIGSPATDDATIADRPDQAAYFTQIADPTKRGPADDGDGDGVANAIEHFMGTSVGDPTNNGKVEVVEPALGSFKVRYPRARNRSGLTGTLRWTTDLSTWYASGKTNGVLTLHFNEATISPPGADPEIIEATAISTGENASEVFVHLRVE